MRDENLADQLRPCPFCAGTDIFIDADEYGSGGQPVPPFHCGCSTCQAEQRGETEEEAITAWNARPGADAAFVQWNLKKFELESALKARWLPIATAPKDADYLLLSDGDHVSMGGWLTDVAMGADYEGQFGGGQGWWTVDGSMTPTHWMPLPQPSPKAFVCRGAGEEGLLCKTQCGAKECEA